MAAAASWVLLAGVHYQRVDIFILTTAELASECSRDIAIECLMIAAVRIVYTCIQKKRPQTCVPLPAVDAVKRSASIALEKRMIALVWTTWMMVAGITQKRRRIPIFLSAVFAVLAHVTLLCRSCS